MQDRLITLKEAAIILQVSERVLKSWMIQKRLSVVRHPKSPAVRVRESEVMRVRSELSNEDLNAHIQPE